MIKENKTHFFVFPRYLRILACKNASKRKLKKLLHLFGGYKAAAD
jgi:hypothetical protein